MGHDIDLPAQGTIQPMQGHIPMSPFIPTSSMPVWMEWKPPITPGTGTLARMDRGWSYIARWIRAIFIGGLMVTYRWYYFAGTVFTLILLILLLTS